MQTPPAARNRFRRVSGIAIGDQVDGPHGKLTQVGPPFLLSRRPYAVYECMCGGIVAARVQSVRSGHRTTCGCLLREITVRRITKHGHYNTPMYQIWRHIIERCSSSSSKGYRYYGGRGIKVCERWQDFEHFLEDMGPRPSPDHSIDRINVNGNYEPTNCRWATRIEQANNKRNNVLVDVSGQSLTIAQWAAVSNVHPGTINSRLKNGWGSQAAVFTPAKPQTQHISHDNRKSYPRIAGIRVGPSISGKFGRLSPVGHLFVIGRYTRVVCDCDCGQIIVPRLSSLYAGTTSSCGCFRDEEVSRRFTKHGRYSQVGPNKPR